MKESRIKGLENQIEALRHSLGAHARRIEELENPIKKKKETQSKELLRYVKENKWGYQWDSTEESDWSRFMVHAGRGGVANYYIDGEWSNGPVNISGPQMSPNDIENELIKLAKEWYKHGTIYSCFNIAIFRLIPEEPCFHYDYDTDSLFEDDFKVYEKGAWANVVGGCDIASSQWTIKNNKTAIFAPEPWMKEIIADIWKVTIHPKLEMTEKYVYTDENEETLFGDCRKDLAFKFCDRIISYDSFCKQSGISTKPNFLFDPYGKIIKVNPESELHNTPGYKPATKKGYEEYIRFAGLEWNGVEPNRVFKEPELILHEGWDDWPMFFKPGAMKMGKSILSRIDELSKDFTDRGVLLSIKEEIKNGLIIPE